MKHLNFPKKLIILLVVCLLVPAGTAFSEEEQKKETETDTQSSVVEKEPEIPRITPEKLWERLLKGEDIMIVDVRSLREYNAQRIVGARSIPIDEIETRIKEFPKDKDIVFY